MRIKQAICLGPFTKGAASDEIFSAMAEMGFAAIELVPKKEDYEDWQNFAPSPPNPKTPRCGNRPKRCGRGLLNQYLQRSSALLPWANGHPLDEGDCV